MECVLCGKTFTGRACYDDHMRSAKHKKKVISFNALNTPPCTPPSLEDTTMVGLKHGIDRCDVCDITFNSLESFITHSLTREHAEKVLAGNMECGSRGNVVSSNSKLPSNESAKNMILSGFGDNEYPHPSVYATCRVCDKSFSGFEPYKQHLESAKHLKKKQMQEGASDPSTFSCEPCKTEFFGKEPYTIHMASEKHKKKIQQLEFSKSMGSAVDDASKMQVVESNLKTLPWFCDICNVQCSGLAPFQQHLNGAAHLKKKQRNIVSPSVNPVNQGEAMEIDSILPCLERKLDVMSTDEPKETGSAVDDPSKMQVDGSNLKTDPWFCDICNVQCTGLAPFQQHLNGAAHLKKQLLKNAAASSVISVPQGENKETDFILPGLEKRLDVMSTDELKKTVKIFLPDEEIKF